MARSTRSHGGHHEEREEHEEHVNHEAWVIPYADMLTLLMALFLVLFAIGRTDASKAALAAQSFKDQLNGSSMLPLSGSGDKPIIGGDGVLDVVPPPGPVDGGQSAEPVSPPSDSAAPTTTSPAEHALAQEQLAHDLAQASYDSLDVVRQRLMADANTNGIRDRIAFSMEARGLVLTIVTDEVLFQPGKADLQPPGIEVLNLVAGVLRTVTNDVSIEGHTDSRPISNPRYPSNWELSTARATSVLRYLIERHALDPQHLSAVGYADTRPIDDNHTVLGATRNRRVEIVIRSAVSLAPVLSDPIKPHHSSVDRTAA